MRRRPAEAQVTPLGDDSTWSDIFNRGSFPDEFGEWFEKYVRHAKWELAARHFYRENPNTPRGYSGYPHNPITNALIQFGEQIESGLGSTVTHETYDEALDLIDKLERRVEQLEELLFEVDSPLGTYGT